MHPEIATQIATLLNKQNQLAIFHTPEMILDSPDRYLVNLYGSRVLGVVAVAKVQWYQGEIHHLSVCPDVRRRGIAKGLLREAEVWLQGCGTRIAQCTVRDGNEASEKLFLGQEYRQTLRFFNPERGTRVAIYQKVL